MEKNRNFHPIKKLKERGREEKQKIQKFIVKRKDDFLTALEKNWRDWLFAPLTIFFKFAKIRANYITYVGFILIAAAIWMYFKDYGLKWQVLILALAGLSDMIDGPTARNNNDITILGTWLDHIRDGALAAWASFLLYDYRLLGIEIIAVIWILQIIMLWILLKDFLIRYLQNLSKEEGDHLVYKFSLDNLQASIVGRLYFTCWAVGYLFLFLAEIYSIPQFIFAGEILIILEIIFSALAILESYQKAI